MNNTYPEICKKQLGFKNENQYLKIVKRNIPDNSEFFFQKISKFLPTIFGFISRSNAKKDILKLFETKIPSELKNEFLYDFWIQDMSDLCKLFCDFLKDSRVSFWIGTNRNCNRYHVDMVPFRLLVTYSGQGTELLPDNAANRNAFLEGKSNEFIVKDKTKIKYINNWDIALFRGAKKGVLHKTPDSAIKNSKSILMRIDSSSFLEEINNINRLHQLEVKA